ncbi:MAG: hypothetical protein QXI84_08345 [Thermofilaceae archaeon]
MLLVIVKSDDKEVAKRVGRMLDALELLPGVYLSWSPREKAARAIGAVKSQVVRRWEEEGAGPTLEAAVLELTEAQFNELRPLARTIVAAAAEAMYEEMGRLLERMRSGKQSRDLSGWYRDLARRYQRLVDASIALDVEPTALARLRERWKEVTLEAGRLFKGR